MNDSHKSAAKIYSLLSIGQRGVGKTVFLVGTYTELQNKQQLWLECEDPEAQTTIENILAYVSRTGNYPPATLKITNFDFNLKESLFGKTQTLCQFRWWDTPGESCHLYNPGFLTMVLNCNGYCLFIDGEELATATDEGKVIDKMLQPIQSIAEIVSQNELKSPLAVILTKCDRLQKNTPNWQILEQRLQSLKTTLEALKVNYKTFHSHIPLTRTNETVTLEAPQAKECLLWLVEEIRKQDAPVENVNFWSKFLNLPPLLRNSLVLVSVGLIFIIIGAIANLFPEEVLHLPEPRYNSTSVEE